jgi:hypothetical protein
VPERETSAKLFQTENGQGAKDAKTQGQRRYPGISRSNDTRRFGLREFISHFISWRSWRLGGSLFRLSF